MNKTQKHFKTALALVLAVLLSFGMLPALSFAETSEQPPVEEVQPTTEPQEAAVTEQAEPELAEPEPEDSTLTPRAPITFKYQLHPLSTGTADIFYPEETFDPNDPDYPYPAGCYVAPHEGSAFVEWFVEEPGASLSLGGTMEVVGYFPVSGYEYLRPPMPFVDGTTYYALVLKKVVLGPIVSNAWGLFYQSADENMGTVTRDAEDTENPYDIPLGSTAVPRPGYRFVKWINHNTLTSYVTVCETPEFKPEKFDRGSVYVALFEVDPLSQLRVARLFGDDRYQTSGAVHTYSSTITSGHSTVILAAGYDEQFADALAASALSGVEAKAPIVVIPKGSLSEEAKTALTDPKTGKVIIVGGEAVIPSSVEAEIQSLNKSLEVRRVAGSDRQRTAEELFKSYSRATWSDTAILVTGESFADALSIAPWASFTKSPLFFTSPGGTHIEASTQELFAQAHFKRLLVIGGEAAVKDSACAQAKEALKLSSDAVIRLGGQDRYETSTLVARWTTDSTLSPSERLSWAGVGIATGSTHSDALSGAALLSLTGSPILLTSPERLSRTEAELASHKEAIYELYFFGAHAVIPPEIISACMRATAYEERGLTLVWRPDDSVGV